MSAKYIDDISRRSCSIMKNGQQFLASLFIGKEKLGSEGYRDETVHRTLSPNLDYPYSRFSKEAERSIYQMAYNKLENPRQPLQSQVLLANFMYKYLEILEAEGLAEIEEREAHDKHR